MHTDIHDSNGIRTQNPSVGASESSSCLTLRGGYHRLTSLCTNPKYILWTPKLVNLPLCIFPSLNAKRKIQKVRGELIAHSPFIEILVSDVVSRKIHSLRARNEDNKTIQFWMIQCWYYWCDCFDDLTWHDILIKVHLEWSGVWRNIKVITSTVWEIVILALIREGFFNLNHWDCTSWNRVHTKSHEDRFRHPSNINVRTSTILEALVLMLLMTRVWYIHVTLRWTERHDTYVCIPHFVNIGTGV
jgi:hypothetical protein